MHSKTKLPKKHVRQHGLTLIELLVAISILGIVAVMGWRGLDSIIRSRTALNNQLEQTRGMQLAFAQLQSDCAHLADNTLLPGRPTINVSSNKLTLIRSINTENQPMRLQVVNYRVQNNKLTRQESAYTRDLKELNNYWQSNLNDTNTTPIVVLQNDIKTMSLKVWLKGTTAWQDSKDAMLTVSLNNGIPPLGLEVVLEQVGYSQGLTKLFLLGVI